MFAIKRRLSATHLQTSDSESFLAVDQYKENTNILKELLEAGNEVQRLEKERVAAERKFLEVVAKLKLWLELVRDDQYHRAVQKHEQEATVSLENAQPVPIPDSKYVEKLTQFIHEENALLTSQEELQHKYQQLLLDAIPLVLKHEVKLVPFLIEKYHTRHAEYETISDKLKRAKEENSSKVEKLEQDEKVAHDKFEEAKGQLRAACAIVHGREQEVVDRLSAYLYVQTEFYRTKNFSSEAIEVTPPPPGLFGPLPVKLPEHLEEVHNEAQQAQEQPPQEQPPQEQPQE